MVLGVDRQPRGAVSIGVSPVVGLMNVLPYLEQQVLHDLPTDVASASQMIQIRLARAQLPVVPTGPVVSVPSPTRLVQFCYRRGNYGNHKPRPVPEPWGCPERSRRQRR